MNVAMQLTPTATSTTLQNVSPMLSADRKEDLYAAWKSIFEHARACETMQPKSHRRTDPRTIENESNSLEPGHTSTCFPGIEPAEFSDALERERGGSPAKMSANPSPRGTTVTTNGSLCELRPNEAGDVASMAAAVISSAQATDIPRSISDVPDTSKALPPDHFASQTESQTQQAMATESVSVFVKGEKVAIVLRDAAISNVTALQSAFETARELTGQRAALQRLTVNGRTLYQQQDDSTNFSPTFEFRC